MKIDVSLSNIKNNQVKFLNDLKYKIKNHSGKYELEVAREVESLFIQILLKSMRNSLTEDNLLDSNQSRLYTEVYDQQISKEMTKKGIGLTNIILKQIQQQKSYK